jgi:hypothetical protein
MLKAEPFPLGPRLHGLSSLLPKPMPLYDESSLKETSLKENDIMDHKRLQCYETAKKENDSQYYQYVACCYDAHYLTSS